MYWNYPLSDKYTSAYDQWKSGERIEQIGKSLGVSHPRVCQMVAEVLRRSHAKTECKGNPDDIINLNISEYIYTRLRNFGIDSISQFIDMNMSRNEMIRNLPGIGPTKADELIDAIYLHLDSN